MSGRMVSASRAETRWIVVRMSPTARTARRSAISSESSAGRKPRMRDQSAVYGSVGTWACMPTSRSTTSTAG